MIRHCLGVGGAAVPGRLRACRAGCRSNTSPSLAGQSRSTRTRRSCGLITSSSGCRSLCPRVSRTRWRTKRPWERHPTGSPKDLLGGLNPCSQHGWPQRKVCELKALWKQVTNYVRNSINAAYHFPGECFIALIGDEFNHPLFTRKYPNPNLGLSRHPPRLHPLGTARKKPAKIAPRRGAKSTLA